MRPACPPSTPTKNDFLTSNTFRHPLLAKGRYRHQEGKGFAGQGKEEKEKKSEKAEVQVDQKPFSPRVDFFDLSLS